MLTRGARAVWVRSLACPMTAVAALPHPRPMASHLHEGDAPAFEGAATMDLRHDADRATRRRDAAWLSVVMQKTKRYSVGQVSLMAKMERGESKQAHAHDGL